MLSHFREYLNKLALTLRLDKSLIILTTLASLVIFSLLYWSQNNTLKIKITSNYCGFDWPNETDKLKLNTFFSKFNKENIEFRKKNNTLIFKGLSNDVQHKIEIIEDLLAHQYNQNIQEKLKIIESDLILFQTLQKSFINKYNAIYAENSQNNSVEVIELLALAFEKIISLNSQIKELKNKRECLQNIKISNKKLIQKNNRNYSDTLILSTLFGIFFGVLASNLTRKN